MQMHIQDLFLSDSPDGKDVGLFLMLQVINYSPMGKSY